MHSHTTQTSTDNQLVQATGVDQLKTELDELIASDCILCGDILRICAFLHNSCFYPLLLLAALRISNDTNLDIMIKSIDKPFIQSNEPDLRSWSIE